MFSIMLVCGYMMKIGMDRFHFFINDQWKKRKTKRSFLKRIVYFKHRFVKTVVSIFKNDRFRS